MAKQPDEQNIKSRARRRLIGAIALALAVVVILPMVLDSEPKITGKDIDLRIPAADKVAEFVPGVAISEVAEAASLAESAVVVASEVLAAPVVVPAASGKITLAEAKPEVGSQTATSKPIEAKQAEVKKTADKPTEAKPVDTKPVDTKPVETATITYVVQVGAFSNPGTAAQEADKLKAWGFKAYTELISGTTRVRVGPYVDRKKADEVRQLLEKHGLHPAITAVK
jgi:DedD protein